MTNLLLSCSTALLLVISATDALSEDVTACGQVVDGGVLTADLDCSSVVTGVNVAGGGTLDLAGYTLVGGISAGVVCLGDCAIEGNGGRVVGGAHWGILQSNLRRTATATLSNLEISGNGLHGIEGQNIEVTNCVIAGNAGTGVYAWRGASVVDSEISENRYAIASERNAEVSGTTMDGNTFGIHSSRRVSLANSTVTDSEGYGVRARRVIAENSTIAGAGGDPYCVEFPGECVDVASAGRPRVVGVTCGTSANLDLLVGNNMEASGQNWGVCTLD